MKIMVLLSGGLDSATCLGLAVENTGSENVIALNAYYGQKHEKEILCARKLAKHYNVKYIEINLADVMKYSDCSLLKGSTKEIEHSSYVEQIDGKTFVATYVPFRNGLFLSVASAIGMSLGANVVWYGAHADDAAGSAYPDCSEAFVSKMNEAIKEGTANQIRIEAPFVKIPKSGIVRIGLNLKVPYEDTWSCYEGGEKPCGKCATCIDRARAFAENNATDPAL